MIEALLKNVEYRSVSESNCRLIYNKFVQYTVLCSALQCIAECSRVYCLICPQPNSLSPSSLWPPAYSPPQFYVTPTNQPQIAAMAFWTLGLGISSPIKRIPAENFNSQCTLRMNQFEVLLMKAYIWYKNENFGYESWNFLSIAY